MFAERMSVGLDVHARSVSAAGIDLETGEVVQAKIGPRTAEVLGWVRGLPGPVAVAYEAGPTGYGLYRGLTGAGVRCVVVAPSKLLRASGDRVKTDAPQAPAPARARAHTGNQRQHARWVRFSARNKKPTIANVAIARELAGWCWSLAVMDG